MTAIEPEVITNDVHTKSYYVIHMKISKTDWFSKGKTTTTVIHVYFKSDRYSSYGGNLNVESHPSSAMQWKTAKGAQAALDRLAQRGIIKDQNEARVVKFTSVKSHVETIEEES